MGSWAAFYVEDISEERVAEACATWLRDQRGLWARLTGRAIGQRAGELSEAENWTLWNPGGRPRRVAVVRHSPRWVMVFYGSFYEPNELAVHVSTELGARVVDTQGQNTSDAYLIAIHDAGQRTRTLEFCEEWITNEGTPLPDGRRLK